jgi:hypothetical protein
MIKRHEIDARRKRPYGAGDAAEAPAKPRSGPATELTRE